MRTLHPPNPARKRVISHHVPHGATRRGWDTLCHLPSVQRSETAQFELLPEAERAAVVQIHTCVRAAQVYRGCCSTCTSPLRSAAARPGSAGTSGSRARSSVRDILQHFAPDIEKHLGDLDVGYTVRASIVSDLAWLGQVQCMPKYRGNAQSGIPGVFIGTVGARL